MLLTFIFRNYTCCIVQLFLKKLLLKNQVFGSFVFGKSPLTLKDKK